MRKIEIDNRIFEIDGRDMFSPTEEVTLEDWLQAMRAQDAANKRERGVETVATHRKRIREKTGQHNGEGVLIWCLTHGYVRMLVMVGAFNAGLMATSQNTAQAFRTSRTMVRAAQGYRLQSLAVIGGKQ